MLKLLSTKVNIGLLEVEKSVVFYARQERPEVLQALLDKYEDKISYTCANKAIFECRFRARREEEPTDIVSLGVLNSQAFNDRYRYFSDFGDTCSLLSPPEHEITTQTGLCLQILRRFTRSKTSRYSDPEGFSIKRQRTDA